MSFDFYSRRKPSNYDPAKLQSVEDRSLNSLKREAEFDLRWQRSDRNYTMQGAAGWGAATVLTGLGGYFLHTKIQSNAVEAKAALPVWQANADKPVTNVQVTFADQPLLKDISDQCIVNIEREQTPVSYKLHKLQADGSIGLDTQLMSTAEVKTAFTACVGQELQARAEMDAYGLIAIPLALMAAAAFPAIMSGHSAYRHHKAMKTHQTNLDAVNTEIARRAEASAAAPQPAA